MNGTQVVQTAVVGQLPANWIIVGSDMNGNIFLRNTATGDVGLWVMNGGHVEQAVDFGPVSLNWTVAGIGDFDGNGSADILWRDKLWQRRDLADEWYSSDVDRQPSATCRPLGRLPRRETTMVTAAATSCGLTGLATSPPGS